MAEYKAPEGVDLRLQVIGPDRATFDIATHPALRGQGLGTLAMQELCQLADELGVALEIHAEPDPEQQSVASLVRWYSGFGFETVGKPSMGAQRMVRAVETH